MIGNNLPQNYVERKFNEHIIQQRGADGYFDATKMCQATSKRWADYHRLDSTQAFIDALSSDDGGCAMNMAIFKFSLEDGSAAELSELSPNDVEGYNQNFKAGIENPERTLFFNRLIAKKEGQGSGTALMKQVVKFLDEKGFSVILEVNPYGKMELNALIKFYQKFGFAVKFREGDEVLMVRQ